MLVGVTSDMTPRYKVLVGDQGQAESLLRAVGALQEIAEAVVSHCEANYPAPKYQPEAIKHLLRPHGWSTEVRVAPYDPAWDQLPINERYDAWKAFESDGEAVGVAVEMAPWDIWGDLLKFRRGLQRGQIHAGILLTDTPYHFKYVYEHRRHVSEPLFGEMPLLFLAPDGPGLRQPSNKKAPTYSAYRYP